MAWRAAATSNQGLIDQLKNFGIVRSERVERAMKDTDRGKYSKHAHEAYQDRPHEIGYSATISAPHMHAECLEMLSDYLKPGCKVLDVGSGSGYLSACFARMVKDREGKKHGKVVGIETVPELVKWSLENINNDDPLLLKEGLLEIKVGDGWAGDEANAPFDVIHVGAAAESLPKSLVEQMKPGGRMIIPVGTFDQNLMQVDKYSDGTVHTAPLMGVRYVPLVRKSQ